MMDVVKKYSCPCCDSVSLREENIYEICAVCWWEDAPGQRIHPDCDLGPNGMSLNEAKTQWKAKQKVTA